MKNIIGFSIFAIFTLLALYVGIWEMFVGGIIQGIEAIKISPVDSVGIALGILRVVFASVVGYLIVMFGVMLGGLVLGSKINIRGNKIRKRQGK